MANVSLFTHKDEQYDTINIGELIAQIKTPKYTSGFDIIRMLLANGEEKQAYEYVNSFRKFSIGSGFMMIEFKDLSVSQLQNAKDIILGSEFTYACFQNLFGTGLVVIVNLGDENADQQLDLIVGYYEMLTGLQIDRSLIGDKCYITYDPGLYLNETCKVFKVCKVANMATVVNPMLDLIADIVPMKTVMPPNADETEKQTAVIEAAVDEDVIPEFGNSPLIPGTVYEQLPDLLKQACGVFKDPKERDIFLTGAICVLSGCFDLFAGKYDQRTVYSNLFCFTYAPAGSGKGVLYYSKKLAMAIHEKLRADIAAGKKMLFIPANISASSMIARLNNNDEKGIILETEADTLNISLTKQWGNMSDILRKSFHHEAVTISRKTSDQLDELEFPRLSIILSGTTDQVKKLIPSAENGLFSRFIFYSCDGVTVWKDLSPNKEVDFESHFDNLSKKVLEIHEFYEKTAKGFHYSPEQWKKHSEIFKKVHSELTQFISQDLNATVKRIGLIHFRIAMILTAIRIAGLNPSEEKVVCSDVDFETATQLALTYLEHAKNLFHTLPAAAKTNVAPAKKQFFDALPKIEFGRKSAIALSTQMGFSKRAADGYLSELLAGKLLVKSGFGKYKKV